MEEVWREIPEWESYEVSNLGRIRSKDRIISHQHRRLKGRVLKLRYDQHGYLQAQIKHDGKRKLMKAHRAVAMAFIPNPDNKPCVNHIDNDPSNNKLENLEWVTRKENTQWMLKQGRADRTEQWVSRLSKSLEWTTRAVIGTNVKTGEEIYFEKLTAVKAQGFTPSSVCCCCKGVKYKTHKGYEWRYANEGRTE